MYDIFLLKTTYMTCVCLYVHICIAMPLALLFLIRSVGFSDPYVYIILMPERRFKIKPVKTDYKSKELNPTYYKEFNMYVIRMFMWWFIM